MDARDRHIADVFGLPHRVYRERKTSEYRWRVLAPASLQIIEDAVNGLWSVEKTAEWLDAAPQDAALCLRRYRMSKEIELGKDAAGRIHKAIASWLSQFDDLSRERREALAKDLGMTIGNQLDWAAGQGQTLSQVAESLEPREEEAAETGTQMKIETGLKRTDEEKPPSWGPQWKD